MARRRPLTREQSLEARRLLAERAAQGKLALPAAMLELRDALGMTQDEFGGMFRLTRRQISEIENGTGNPTVDTLNRIAKVFGFTVGLVPKRETASDGEIARATSKRER